EPPVWARRVVQHQWAGGRGRDRCGRRRVRVRSRSGAGRQHEDGGGQRDGRDGALHQRRASRVPAQRITAPITIRATANSTYRPAANPVNASAALAAWPTVPWAGRNCAPRTDAVAPTPTLCA